MKIIFVSATCSPKQYKEICNKRIIPMLDSSQKFFDMFLNGLTHQKDIKIECISVPPVSHGTYPGWKVGEYQESKENITYHSVGVINYPILKTITAQHAVKSKIKSLVKTNKDETFIVADPLLLEGTIPVIKMGRKYKKKTIGFLTDLPDFADECDEHGFLKRLFYRVYNKKCNQYLNKFDKYIFLTEAMNDAVNNQKKPWMLMECLVDGACITKKLVEKHEGCPAILYAGKLHKQFGLDILAEATTKVKTDCMFHIYGDGNYREELEKRANIQNNLRMHGIVPVDEVVKEEMKSTLLVNPRTSYGEFTRYSFPSKTAEYMLSGVPVVMFKLPGIPKEYDEYLYYAEEETAESLARKIDEILEFSACKLVEKGEQARKFILKEKNNIRQASRFVEFCMEKHTEGDGKW